VAAGKGDAGGMNATNERRRSGAISVTQKRAESHRKTFSAKENATLRRKTLEKRGKNGRT